MTCYYNQNLPFVINQYTINHFKSAYSLLFIFIVRIIKHGWHQLSLR